MGKRRFWKRIMAILLILAAVNTMIAKENADRLPAKAAEGGTEIVVQALSGNEISIEVQLIDKYGFEVSLAKPVNFYDGNGKRIKSGDTLYSEEREAVSVTSVDAYTDIEGRARIRLKSLNAATIRNITAAVSGYSVKYLVNTNFENGQMQLLTEQIGVRWIEAGAAGIPRVSGIAVQIPKGENVTIKAQLMSEDGQYSGVPVYDSDVSISFIIDGLSIDTQEIVSDEGSRIKVLSVDSYTKNGIACLELCADEEATIKRISTKISSEYNDYSVKYLIGSNEMLVNRLDVSWTGTAVSKATPTPVPTKTPTATPTPSPGKNNLSDLNDISCYVKNTRVSSGGRQKAAVKVTWTEKEEAYKYQVYRAEAGKLSKLRAVCGASSSGFVDKNVKKGVKYYYKVRALGGTVQNSYTGDFSSIKAITVPSSLIKPVISHKKSKGKLTIYFKKAEGDKYQMQYLFGGRKQWKKGPSGNLKSKVTKGFSAKENVKIRIRTAMKVNGKQVYSKWSSTITVKA